MQLWSALRPFVPNHIDLELDFGVVLVLAASQLLGAFYGLHSERARRTQRRHVLCFNSVRPKVGLSGDGGIEFHLPRFSDHLGFSDHAATASS